MSEEPRNLEELLERFCSARVGDDHQVTVRSLLEEVGRQSFGPLLLFAGAVLTSPLSGIPAMPTTMGVIVLLLSVQLLMRREHFWLPRWLLDRSVSRSKVLGAVRWLRPPARFVDKFLRPRLTWLVRGPGVYVVAAVCLLISTAVPFMEVVPFSATMAGAAVTAFGLSLTARDGVVAIVAFVFTAGTVVLVLYNFL